MKQGREGPSCPALEALPAQSQALQMGERGRHGPGGQEQGKSAPSTVHGGSELFHTRHRNPWHTREGTALAQGAEQAREPFPRPRDPRTHASASRAPQVCPPAEALSSPAEDASCHLSNPSQETGLKVVMSHTMPFPPPRPPSYRMSLALPLGARDPREGLASWHLAHRNTHSFQPS